MRAGEPILFRHCHTSQYLASDCVSEKNDFGTEYEVSCHSFSSQNKTQNLALEKNGMLTTDVPTRFQQPQNVWMIETAPDASHAAPIEELQKFNVAELLNDLCAFVKDQSSAEAVRKVLEACDEQKTGLIDAEDFRWALIDLGYKLHKPEADHLVAFFGSEGAESFKYEDFLGRL